MNVFRALAIGHDVGWAGGGVEGSEGHSICYPNWAQRKIQVCRDGAKFH